MANKKTTTDREFDRALGEEIRDRRIRLGLTLEALGKTLGVSYQQAAKYERGENRVSARILVRLAGALRLTVMDLLPNDEPAAAPVASPVRTDADGVREPMEPDVTSIVNRLRSAYRIWCVSKGENLPENAHVVLDAADAIEGLAALSKPEGETGPAVAEPVAWRCYHCDETFTSEQCARLHFGRDEGCTPACQIKGSEGGLVAALRRAEDDAAEAWSAIHSETTDAAKAYHSQMARHREQLTAIEQLGYDRGIADAKAHPETLGLAALTVSPSPSERDQHQGETLREIGLLIDRLRETIADADADIAGELLDAETSGEPFDPDDWQVEVPVGWLREALAALSPEPHPVADKREGGKSYDLGFTDGMTAEQLDEAERHCSAMFDQRGEHGGSPGEFWAEALMEINTARKRLTPTTEPTP